MIAVFANSGAIAEDWMRCSGADPAQCVVIVDEAQLLPCGVYGYSSLETTGEEDFFDAEEITEIVTVGSFWFDHHPFYLALLEEIREWAA